MQLTANLNHIVLKIRSCEVANDFYCGTLSLINRSQQDRFLSVEIGDFILNFTEDSEFNESWIKGIAHIGLQFDTRKSVDKWHQALSLSKQVISLSKITGGLGKGPYRFYLKDPHGYCFEFESWEGGSD